MLISSVSSGNALARSVAAVTGQTPTPQEQKAQVDAQRDLLQKLQSGNSLAMKMVAARVSDGKGVDLYM